LGLGGYDLNLQGYVSLCAYLLRFNKKTRVYFKRGKVEEARQERADLVNNEAKR